MIILFTIFAKLTKTNSKFSFYFQDRGIISDTQVRT